MMAVWTVWAVGVSIMMIIRHTHGDISCEAVTNSHNTTVTCFFGQYINNTHDIYVFSMEGSGADEELLLACNLKTDRDLQCQSRSGFYFDKKVSDQLTLTGPPALNGVGEQYWCNTLPDLEKPVHFCIMTSNDHVTTTTKRVQPTSAELPSTRPNIPATSSIPSKPTKPTSPDHRGHTDKDKYTTDDKGHWTHGIAVFTLVIVLALISTIIILAVIFYRRRKRIMKWCLEGVMPTSDPEENTHQPSKDPTDVVPLVKTSGGTASEESVKAPVIKNSPQPSGGTASEDLAVNAPLIENSPQPSGGTASEDLAVNAPLIENSPQPSDRATSDQLDSVPPKKNSPQPSDRATSDQLDSVPPKKNSPQPSGGTALEDLAVNAPLIEDTPDL